MTDNRFADLKAEGQAETREFFESLDNSIPEAAVAAFVARSHTIQRVKLAVQGMVTDERGSYIVQHLIDDIAASTTRAALRRGSFLERAFHGRTLSTSQLELFPVEEDDTIPRDYGVFEVPDPNFEGARLLFPIHLRVHNASALEWSEIAGDKTAQWSRIEKGALFGVAAGLDDAARLFSKEARKAYFAGPDPTAGTDDQQGDVIDGESEWIDDDEDDGE